MTSTPPVYEGTCAYCGLRTAVNRDHVVPWSLQKKLRKMGRPLSDKLADTVKACFDCNMRKGTRHLVPPSWEHLLDELNEVVGGAEWRVWRGGVDEPAFREVWR